MPDIGNRLAFKSGEGTVAFATVDGRPVFGINSQAPGYTVADSAAAQSMRAALIERYPNFMNTTDLGAFPNDALFHAETTTILRAAEQNGGSLEGQMIEMNTDRELCRRCDTVLPLVSRQVGNPTVRITDGTGAVWVARDGSWILRGRP
jgi:hypothetical protein